MSESPNLGLPLLSGEQAQKHVTANEALRALDALVQLSVLTRGLGEPPGAPADGDRYIVAGGASGAWSGHEDEIAVRQGAAWIFHAPREGWRCWVEDEDAVLIFDGSAWVDLGAAFGALQNLDLLGVGTTADAVNPLAAKLGNVLFTARYVAEGGDGDLRLKLNKEATGDTVSQLYQRNSSGRAETGLIGDDDYTIKVSPDGSAWVEALRIDKDDGSIDFGPTEHLLFLDRTNDRVLLGVNSGKTNIYNFGGVAQAPSLQKIGETAAEASFAFLSIGTTVGTVYVGHALGSLGAETAHTTNTGLGQLAFSGYDGTNFVIGSMIRGQAQGAPSTDNVPGLLAFWTNPGANAPLERLRIDKDGALIHRDNAQTVVDANSHLRLRSYTIATLPSASPAGQLVYCSDLGGGGGELVSDGAAWRRTSLSGVTEISTDADFTLATLTSAPTSRVTATLSNERTVTLSTAGTYNGSRFTIARSGGGIGLLLVGALKSLAGGQWCTVEYDGAAWRLVAFGAL